MSGIPQRDLTDRLVKLFNVKPASQADTKMFKDISHRQLAEAFEYWIDQCKTLLGEAVWLDHSQSLQDAGVDLLAKLLKSQQKFGVQVKSYGDIKEKSFSTKVLAQIQQSRKHAVKHLILGFGADMMDDSQSQKVSIMISELSQQKDNDYVIPISPERVITIYKAFKAKEHPLKFIEIDFQQAIGITGGLAEALSNETRKVTVTINVENLDIKPEDFPFKTKIKFKLSKDDISFMDVISRAAKTGETVTLSKDQIEEITIFEKDKMIAKYNDLQFLKIIPEKKKFSLDLESLAEDDSVIYSIKGLDMVVNDQGNNKKVALVEDINNPLRISMLFDTAQPRDKYEIGLNMEVDPSVGTSVELLKALEFLYSLTKAKRLKLIDVKTGEAEIVDLSVARLKGTNQAEIDFVKALSVIQKRTGMVLRVPSNLKEFDPREINFVFMAAKAVTEGKMPITGLTTSSKMQRLEALQLLDSYLKGKVDDYLRNEDSTVEILRQPIRFGPTKVHLSKFKINGDMQEIYDKLKESQEDSATLFFTALDDAEMELEWFQKPKNEADKTTAEPPKESK